MRVKIPCPKCQERGVVAMHDETSLRLHLPAHWNIPRSEMVAHFVARMRKPSGVLMNKAIDQIILVYYV